MVNCGFDEEGCDVCIAFVGWGVWMLLLCAQTVGRCLFELMSCVIVVV